MRRPRVRCCRAVDVAFVRRPASRYLVCFSAALQELLPGILGQMGKDNLQMLKKLAEAYTRKAGEGGVVRHPFLCCLA